MSDLAVVDPYGRRHTGGIYAASNGWWAGVSEGHTWRGFVDPATGARISRWCGGRNRTQEECPPGWRIEPGARLNRFLWFPTREAGAARSALTADVRVAVQDGLLPVWRRPAEVRRDGRMAYLSHA